MDCTPPVSHCLLFPPSLPPFSPSLLPPGPALSLPSSVILISAANLSFLLLLSTCPLHMCTQGQGVPYHHHLHEAHQDRGSSQSSLPFQTSKALIDLVPCHSPWTSLDGSWPQPLEEVEQPCIKTKHKALYTWHTVLLGPFS